jgi:hypothetical protein
VLGFFKRRSAPRMWEWLVAALVLLAVIGFTAPQQVPVVLYKLSLVTIAVIASYWLDRAMFKDVGTMKECFVAMARVPELRQVLLARMIVRAAVFIGVVIGVTLGL